MSELPIILEAAMILCFGISWPLSILRSIKSRSTKGKSLMFMCFIEFGYVCGITGKILGGNITTSWIHIMAFIFYIVNLIMVATDIMLYFRNKQLEKKAEKAVLTK